MPCLCSTGIITAEEYKIILKWAIEHELVCKLTALVSYEETEMVEEIMSLLPKYRSLTIKEFWLAVVRVTDCTDSIDVFMYGTFVEFSEREIELLALSRDPIRAVDECKDIHELSFLANSLASGGVEEWREMYRKMLDISIRAFKIFDKYKV